ncbi:hypothetical protein WG68_11340 [Arsukibacterium ikkense]|uniref:Uncharacterized protein n=1 Tax=Arsukibacterium ikkense TaxID=336831 RepID=A0A0M2V3V1_9GAMM|nr:hypothetical protein [Arsukibacterium ikkense]KKO45311.1 hypothetical protein WG68_11340 [Arsukibacterium ikkense]
MKVFMLVLCSSTLLFSQLAMAKPDQEKSLPPGLEKKLERGQPLPPGWQKKLAPGQFLAEDYYRHARIIKQPNAEGIISVQIEDTIIELFENTREIVRVMNSSR